MSSSSDCRSPVSPSTADRPPRTARRLAAVALALLAAAGAWAVWMVWRNDPATAGWPELCLFHRTTGLHCPGCGGTRAAHQLLHGDWLAALDYNALAVLFLPLLVGAPAWYAARALGWRPPAWRWPRWAPWAALVLVVGFSVARNLPWWPGPLLAP